MTNDSGDKAELLTWKTHAAGTQFPGVTGNINFVERSQINFDKIARYYVRKKNENWVVGYVVK